MSPSAKFLWHTFGKLPEMAIPLLVQRVPCPTRTKPDHTSSKENFPNIQYKPLLVQPGAISHCAVSCYLEEADPHLDTTTSFGVALESSDGNAVS